MIVVSRSVSDYAMFVSRDPSDGSRECEDDAASVGTFAAGA